MSALSPLAQAPALAIPRVIHRVWLGGAMPAKYQEYGQTWLDRHPGWQMRTWGDADLRSLTNQAQFDAAATLAQKADIARYEILAKHGGIYVDTDFECLRNLEPLLGGVRGFAAFEDPGLLSNALMGAVPGHPVFMHAMKLIPEVFRGNENNPKVNEVTGPVFLTKLVGALRLAAPEFVTFETKYFYPYSWREKHRANESFPEAYAVHHWAHSWNAGKVAHDRQAPAMLATRLDLNDTERSLSILSAAVTALKGSGLGINVIAVNGEVTENVVAQLQAVDRSAGGTVEIAVIPEDATENLGAPLVFVDQNNPGGFVRAFVRSNRRALSPTQVKRSSRPPAPDPAPRREEAAAAPRVPVYLGNDRLLVPLRWGGKLLVRASDLSLTPDLALSGEFDPGLTRFLLRTLQPGMVVADVGANIGVFTVLMAHKVGRSGKVFAVEANPHVAALLRENVAMNYMSEWTTIHEAAAASAAGEVTFHISKRFQGNSSLLEHSDWYKAHFGIDEFEQVKVRAIRLEDILEKEPVVHLVKLDVEGSEPEILRGMMQGLRAGRIKAVTLELVRKRTPDALWQDLAGMFVELESLGRRFHVLRAGGEAESMSCRRILDAGWFDNILID